MAVALVQASSSPSSTIGAIDTAWWFYLPNPTLTGNAITVEIQVGTGVTSCTLTDDKGNTYTGGLKVTGGQKLFVFYVLNATAGTRKFTATFDVAQGFFSASVQEWSGVATSGTVVFAAGGTLQSGTVAAGSFTPTTTGDLVVQFGVDSGASPAAGITGFTKGSGYTALSANRYDGIYVQWRTAPGGAINPSFTVGGSTDTWDTIAFSLPGGGTGTNPSGMYIRNVHQYFLDSSWTSTTLTFDAPSSSASNLLHLSWIGFRSTAPGTADISSMSDNKSNTFTQRGTRQAVGGVTGDVQHFSAQGGTNDDGLVVTVTMGNNQNGGSTLYIYDVVGAATSAYDTNVDSTGTQSSAGNLNCPSATITPAAAGGIIFASSGIESHATSGTSGVALYDSPGNATEDGGGNPIHEDNGWAHYNPPNTSAVQFTFTIQHNTAGVNRWAGKATSYLAPAVITPTMGRCLYVMP